MVLRPCNLIALYSFVSMFQNVVVTAFFFSQNIIIFHISLTPLIADILRILIFRFCRYHPFSISMDGVYPCIFIFRVFYLFYSVSFPSLSNRVISHSYGWCNILSAVRVECVQNVIQKLLLKLHFRSLCLGFVALLSV